MKTSQVFVLGTITGAVAAWLWGERQRGPVEGAQVSSIIKANVKRIILGSLLLGGLGLPGSSDAATLLTLTDVAAGSEIGQTGDDPCVIGESSCGNNQPVGVPWTDINVPSGSWDLASPEYTIQQLIDALGTGGSVVSVGIDVNVTGESTEVLDYFQVVIDGVLVAYYGDGAANTVIGAGGGNGLGPALANAVDLKNGTGWSDWVLETFDLSAFSTTAKIQFYAGMENTGDGQEQFFLTNDFGNGPPPLPAEPLEIPQPAALILLGAGLAGVAGLRFRSRRG